jgi:hypothetical protein
MKWQLFFKINALVNQIVFMLMDGKLTSSEAVQLFNLGLNLVGVSAASGEYFTFVEQDGDLHIILKKSLLDKLKIDLGQ